MNELIFEIYHTSTSVNPFYASPQLYNKIYTNFEKYRNVDISELDADHSWIPINDSNSFINNSLFFYHNNKPMSIYLKSYRCAKTNVIGFTYAYKNKYVIKPFVVVSHDWLYVDSDEFNELKKIKDFNRFDRAGYGYYKCKKCDAYGKRAFSTNVKEIVPITGNCLLSCNDRIVADIVI